MNQRQRRETERLYIDVGNPALPLQLRDAAQHKKGAPGEPQEPRKPVQIQ